ncbi:MAG: hypothetical protein FWD78_15430 [Treponema sp.]|nr:hypothetical protein [Treponema sp.]
MKILPFFFLSFILVLCPGFAGAQETFDYWLPETARPPLAPENPDEVPRQFRGLVLGMDLNSLKTALTRDDLLAFRGDRDVSIIPGREETLVETTGASFIKRAFFQLTGGNVYIMAFTLDTAILDHYSVYTSLVKKYGEPDYLDPSEAVWESDETRLSIERPLTVKYIDKKVFNGLIDASKAQENLQQFQREEFLNEF